MGAVRHPPGDEGYMAVEVVDPPQSDTAILAEPIDFEAMLEAHRFIGSSANEALEQQIKALSKKSDEARAWDQGVE
jgi:hypothetical protein